MWNRCIFKKKFDTDSVLSFLHCLYQKHQHQRTGKKAKFYEPRNPKAASEIRCLQLVSYTEIKLKIRSESKMKLKICLVRHQNGSTYLGKMQKLFSGPVNHEWLKPLENFPHLKWRCRRKLSCRHWFTPGIFSKVQYVFDFEFSNF